MKSPQTPLIFCLLATMVAHAADQKIFLLTLLPIDIHEHIAKFLDFDYCEKKDEFIARTRGLKKIGFNSYVPYNVFGSYLGKYEIGTGSCGNYAAYCPNKTKLAIFEGVHSVLYNLKPKLMLVHIEKKKVFHTENELNTNIREIALSRTGKKFALLRKSANPFGDMSQEPLVLSVKSIGADTEKTFEISRCLCHEHTHLAFNKQGTQIIVHHAPDDMPDSGAAGYIAELKENEPMDIDDGKQKCSFACKKYTIFDLASAEEIAKADQKTLLNYLFYKGVCKPWKATA